MRKAALVLATSVAFLLSADVFAARKDVAHPPFSDSFSSGTASNNGNFLDVSSAVPGVTVDTTRGALSVPLRSVSSIPNSSITSLVKDTLKATPAAVATTLAFAALLEAVDWLVEDGQVFDVSGSSSYYLQASPSIFYSDFDTACSVLSSAWKNSSSYFNYRIIPADNIDFRFYCAANYVVSQNNIFYFGSIYKRNSSVRVPVTNAEIDNSAIFNDAIANLAPSLKKDAIRDSCTVKAQPKNCYDSLPSRRRFDGPDSIDLPDIDLSSTEITLNGDTNTSNTTQSSEVSFQYDDNSIEWNETITNNTTNSNGSSKTDTEKVTVPTLPPLAIDPWTSVPDDITGTSGGLSFLPYSPTFSMGGGGCSEWTFLLPVVGNLTTNYCPIHEQYVRPTLAFFFYLWTVLHIFHIARDTVTIVRAK